MTALFGFLELFLVLPIIAIALLGTVFWVWMLIDCAVHEPNQGNEKIVWILIILFTHLLGAAIYFFARRPARITESGSRPPY